MEQIQQCVSCLRFRATNHGEWSPWKESHQMTPQQRLEIKATICVTCYGKRKQHQTNQATSLPA